ncbi:hypothetical protein L6164_000314 [Bauhinia variegata]|uniref:Uncharacterized protein n=1 Tax=Bauhinia variegata TaxID=167791 RepID=A0ACB9Q8X7_BAUVA|nr:hypothetical protein L6164_000314 [Bauhinia variegata]
MEFLAVAVDKLWKYTVVPVARQVGYVIFYHSNVNELKMEVEELQRARERLQHKIDAAERNGERIEGDVLNWLTQVDEMKMKTDDLNNVERHANTTCSGRSIPNLLLRHKLSRGSKKMKEEIVKIKAKGSFDSVSYRGPNLIRASSLTTHGEKFGSRVSVLDDITKELQDPNVQTIGLYGPAGVGKTTLVEEVANKSQQQNLFDVVVLAYVRQNPKMEEIQSQIAYKLGLELKETNSSVRANELHNRLMMKEEKVLVIFDDLWEELKLHEIGIPSIKQHKGLKILMTSRNRELLSNRMNTHKNFCLPVLTKDEGWKLFIDKAQFDESSANEELKSIATKIVEKCGGLPVAIVTIASSLKKKSSSAWNDALRRLQNPSPTDITTTEADLYKFIEVSYENLDNYLYRSVFLLLGEMTSISSINDLFKISVGLGLFENIDNMEKARDSFHTCINKLKDTCLLQDSDFEDRFVMHDVVQAAAIFLASKHQYLFMKKYEELQEWPGKDQLQNCETIILQKSKIDELPEELDCPNLAFFHLNSGDSYLEVPHNFFKGMCGLKVLNLIGRKLKFSPQFFSHLSNLCTLHLESYSHSEGIPKIGELKRLKVLTLELGIQQLPQELGQLTQLQSLDLRYCSCLVMIPPNVLSSFSKLVELYLPNSIHWYIDDPNNQRCNASLAELRKLTRLTTLKIVIPDQRMLPKDLVLERLQRYDITIGRYRERLIFSDTLKKLEFNLSTGIHLWENFKRLLDNVEALVFEDLKDAKNVVPEIIVEGMPQLKELSLSSSDEIQTIIESSGLNHGNAIDIFPNLEQLRIEQMTNLIRLWDGPLAGKSFSRLESISVYDCPTIKILFSAFTFKEEIVSDNEKVLHFPQLRFLSLVHLPELISFCNEDETYSSAQSTQLLSDMGDNNSFTHTALFDDKVIFPSLEVMTISGAFKLNTIWHCQRQLRPNSFDKLKMLKIEKCERLRYLFPASVAKNLCKLQKLEVKKCHMMEDIIMKDDSANPPSSDKVLFPNLEELIITDMDKLNRICCWNQQRLYPNSFGRLREVEIKKCSELISIFPCHKISTTPRLQKLTIIDCKSLEQIFHLQGEKQATEVSGFPNLEKMKVEGCERLKYLFPAFVGRILEKVRKLTIGKCLNMEEIIMVEDNSHHSFNKEVVFPNLEEMIIYDMDKLNTIWDMQQRLAPNSFGRLYSITIRNCPRLISIFPSYLISMIQSLTYIIVEGCGGLKHLLPATVAKELSKLGSLTIKRCPMIEVLITDDNSNQSSIDEILFPNLEEFIILDMDKLNTICHWLDLVSATSFGKLRTLEISSCPKFIFPSHIKIQSLEKLRITNCKYLEQISGDTLVAILRSNPKLMELCVAGYHCLPFLFSKGLDNLRLLTIKECSMMEEIIRFEDDIDPPFGKTVLFPNLEEMTITNMDMLNKIWCWQHKLARNSFGRLRKIEIINCPELVSTFPCDIISTTLSLEELTVIDCKSLEQIVGPRGVNPRETDGDTNDLPVEVKQQRDLNINVKGCNSVLIKKKADWVLVFVNK